MNKKELFRVPLLLHFICLSEVKKKKKTNPYTHTLLQRMHLCVLNYSSASKPPLSFTCISGRDILQHGELRLISWSQAGGLRTEETKRVKLVKLKSPLSRLSLCLCHFGLFILVILLFLDSCFVSFWGFVFLASFNWPVKAHFSYRSASKPCICVLSLAPQPLTAF